MTGRCLAGLLGFLLLGTVSGADVDAWQVQWPATGAVTFAETWSGRGLLVRGQGEQAAELALEVTGQGRRSWQVVDRIGDDTELLQTMGEAGAVLTVADEKYVDDQPGRAFEMLVQPGGGVLRANPVPREEPPRPDDPYAALPFDFDLGELFCLLELGLLPPRGLDVGETWEAPAPADGGLSARGRLAALEDSADGPVATLETRYATPIPERPTPAEGVVAVGTLTGQATIVFEVKAGRVRRATGPLELRLEFRRLGTGATLGKVALDLALSASRVPD